MSQTPSSKLSESQTEESRFLKAKEAWSTALQDCVHADAWGQVVEAHEGYQQLAKDIRRKIPLFTISDGLRTRRTEFQPKDAVSRSIALISFCIVIALFLVHPGEYFIAR